MPIVSIDGVNVNLDAIFERAEKSSNLDSKILLKKSGKSSHRGFWSKGFAFNSTYKDTTKHICQAVINQLVEQKNELEEENLNTANEKKINFIDAKIKAISDICKISEDNYKPLTVRNIKVIKAVYDAIYEQTQVAEKTIEVETVSKEPIVSIKNALEQLNLKFTDIREINDLNTLLAILNFMFKSLSPFNVTKENLAEIKNLVSRLYASVYAAKRENLLLKSEVLENIKQLEHTIENINFPKFSKVTASISAQVKFIKKILTCINYTITPEIESRLPKIFEIEKELEGHILRDQKFRSLYPNTVIDGVTNPKNALNNFSNLRRYAHEKTPIIREKEAEREAREKEALESINNADGEDKTLPPSNNFNNLSRLMRNKFATVKKTKTSENTNNADGEDKTLPSNNSIKETKVEENDSIYLSAFECRKTSKKYERQTETTENINIASGEDKIPNKIPTGAQENNTTGAQENNKPIEKPTTINQEEKPNCFQKTSMRKPWCDKYTDLLFSGNIYWIDNTGSNNSCFYQATYDALGKTGEMFNLENKKYIESPEKILAIRQAMIKKVKSEIDKIIQRITDYRNKIDKAIIALNKIKQGDQFQLLSTDHLMLANDLIQYEELLIQAKKKATFIDDKGEKKAFSSRPDDDFYTLCVDKHPEKYKELIELGKRIKERFNSKLPKVIKFASHANPKEMGTKDSLSLLYIEMYSEKDNKYIHVPLDALLADLNDSDFLTKKETESVMFAFVASEYKRPVMILDFRDAKKKGVIDFGKFMIFDKDIETGERLTANPLVFGYTGNHYFAMDQTKLTDTQKSELTSLMNKTK